MLSFTTFVLWLHLSSITVWIGGIFAVSFVSVPVIRREAGSSGKDVTKRIQDVAGRFQRISREVLLIILLTGAFNVINAGIASEFHFSGWYLRLLGTKVFLFLAMVGIQLWQTYRLLPRLRESDGTRAVLRRFYLTSVLSLVLAATVILMGLKLRYGS